MRKVFFYNTKIGELGIVEDDYGITEIFIKDKEKIIKENSLKIEETSLIKKAYSELEEYFNGKRKEFTFKLSLKGTDFQKKVWNELMNIHYGETRSYKEIAMKIGKPTAARAVGMANNKNKILIAIPCHRVIGQDGSLVGYEAGLDMKKYLLDLEKENKK